MKLVPFNFHHVQDFAPRAINLLGMARPMGQHILDLARLGPFMTVLDGQDRPVVIGGVALQGEGQGEAWVAATDWAELHPVTFTRTVGRWLDTIMTAHELHRISAFTAAGAGDQTQELRLLRFVEVLGFRRVGLLAGVGQHRIDLWLHELVRDE